jgi:hypothetical protein
VRLELHDGKFLQYLVVISHSGSASKEPLSMAKCIRKNVKVKAVPVLN